MRERPIIFGPEMVRAILEGRKTQTRRVVKVGPNDEGWKVCPYGVPGDRLWVRETWQVAAWDEGMGEVCIDYRADGWIKWLDVPAPEWKPSEAPTRWRPSIFMPRWASRITLEITGVRVERVQEIPLQDIDREGTPAQWPSGAEQEDFKALWDSINARRGFGWDKNPWVWVIEFRRLKP